MFHMQGCREVAMLVGEGGRYMRGDTRVLHERV